VVGGVIGSTIQHAAGDTTGWEYIVREPKGDLISVTQREAKPIPIGQKVLVIEGKQARIVPDYATAAFETPPTPKAEEKHDQDKPAATDSASARTAMPAAGAPSPSAAGDSAGAAAAPPSADKDRLPSNQPAPASAGSGNEPAAPPS
jgi:outer membrane lipoprotein SlyB